MTGGAVPSISRLHRGARRGVPLDSAQLVAFEPLLPSVTTPLLCRPVLRGLSLTEWSREHRAKIEEKVLAHGAVLFRGFGVSGLADFNRCIDVISGGALEYKFRASPRTQIGAEFNIYSSTDYPPNEPIFPHNEHSYSPVFPQHLYFYCDTPAASGGETPIGDGRALLARIDPAVREAFIRRGVMYVRNYGDGMGLPWQTVFQSDSRSAVEAYCRKIGVQAEWKSDGRLRTRQVGPAMIRHPQTGEAVWFNHCAFFNALSLPRTARDTLIAEFGPEDLPQNTFYGDGAPIEPETIAHLQDAYRAVMVDFPWQEGDVLLIDNILALHARNPYSGSRKVYVAMAVAQTAVHLAVADGATS